MPLNEFFAALRIRCKLEETGKWIPNKYSNEVDYVDVQISEEEAKRLVALLSDFLAKKENAPTS